MPPETAPRPVAPYLALGLSTVIYGISARKQIRHNLETIEEAIHAGIAMVNINMPVKIIALADVRERLAMLGFLALPAAL